MARSARRVKFIQLTVRNTGTGSSQDASLRPMEDFVGEEQEKSLLIDLIRDFAIFGHIVDDGRPRFLVG